MSSFRRDLLLFSSVMLVGIRPDLAAGAATWTPTGSMLTRRAEHTATLLENGKVLVAGGIDRRHRVFDSAEIFDPATGTWTATGAMTIARRRHTATLLPNGKVLVAGGWGPHGALTTAELYDPATQTWSAVEPMGKRRRSHTATSLPNAKVLVVGGTDANGQHGGAELFDPRPGSGRRRVARSASTRS
jgi:N-acetylneuraminic acid mutarotase